MSLFFRDNVKYDMSRGQVLDGASIREMFRPQWINTDLQSGYVSLCYFIYFFLI
jgi:hypothetical protein